MKIFLIGFMGSGKTSIGKRLASRLNYQFLDLDQIIEDQENKSIQEIFSDHGEGYFRTVEQQCLEGHLPDNSVISLGGGTPCFEKNMDFILQNGIAIYLEVPVPILVSRLMNAKTERPLLAPYIKDKERMTDFVNELLSKRMPTYERGQIHFNAANVKAEDFEELEKSIESYLQSQA